MTTSEDYEFNDATRLLLIKMDSYLSLARYRYNDRWPLDLKQEVDSVIAEVRKIT